MSMQNILKYIEGGVCAAKGFKASGTYCGIKKPANNGIFLFIARFLFPVKQLIILHLAIGFQH